VQVCAIREMNARCSLVPSGVVGVLVALGLAVPLSAPAAGKTSIPTYTPGAVVHCLTRHRVGAGVLPQFVKYLPGFLRKKLPRGVTAVVNVTQLVGPGADGVTSRMFRTATIYFFRTAALARKGEASVGFLRALNKPPPIPTAARYLHRVAGNVIVVWNYPRGRGALSEHVVDVCLAATGK
jgi:hypothetical protein